MKKKIILLVESLLLILAFLIDYISRNNLSLAGKIAYINNILEKSLSDDIFKLGFLFLGLLILVLAAKSYSKTERKPILFWFLVILTMVSGLSITMLSKTSHSAYYFLNLALFLSTLLQAMAYRISLN